ncbi:MAG: hypothetical protein DRN30_01975 [Thermoplasmata archaeon]|nr:hypothetical protein [Euryarchaeota archaeon]RLF66514.1 MAG: hypothetical protein DRN30_01975 [Thermoplasmata archaeon]
MEDIARIRKTISEIKGAYDKEIKSSKLIMISDEQYEHFIEIAKLCAKILESKEYKYKRGYVNIADIYLKTFKKFVGERLKKIMRSVVEGEDSSSLNLTKIEKELYDKLFDVVEWFNSQVMKSNEEELVIVRIVSSTNEPILDLEGRFLSLSPGDILRTKKSIAKHLVDVGLATYVDYK